MTSLPDSGASEYFPGTIQKSLAMEASVGVWAAVVTVGISLLLLVLRRFNDCVYGLGKRLPPGNFGWPMIGESRELVKDFMAGKPNLFMNRKFDKYGKRSAYKTHLFGRATVALPTYDGIKFCAANGDLFGFGLPNASQIVGKEAFSVMTGARLKRFREIVMEALNGPKALQEAIPIMDRITKEALAEAAAQEKVDMWEVCKKLVQGSEMEVFAGSFTKEEFDLFHGIFITFVKGLFSNPINLPGFGRYNSIQARLRFERWLQERMDQRRAAKTEHTDAIAYLMNTTDEKGKKLSDKVITVNMFGFFAGSQSTSRPLFWTSLFLQRHPQYLQELREEHQKIAATKKPGEILTNDDMKNMQFTKKIFDESMRMINLFPWLFRTAEVDVEFQGITIPKGFMVLPWLRALHMDPNYFDDPETFNPHRWNDPKTRKAPFLPFGYGSRICPGQAQAYLQVALFLYNLTQGYKWEFAEPFSDVTCIPDTKPVNSFAVVTPLI